jgi:hypothetical protein
MLAEHRSPVWRLIDDHAPGVSLRELCARDPKSQVKEHRLRYWTNPSSQPKRMPSMDLICGLAELLRCSVNESYRAFRCTLDPAAYIGDPELAQDERRLLAAYRRLGNKHDRDRAIRFLEEFGTTNGA